MADPMAAPGAPDMSANPDAAGDSGAPSGAPVTSLMVDILDDGTYLVHPEPKAGQPSAPVPCASIDDLAQFIDAQAAAAGISGQDTVTGPNPAAAGAGPAPAPSPAPSPSAGAGNPLARFGNPNR